MNDYNKLRDRMSSEARKISDEKRKKIISKNYQIFQEYCAERLKDPVEAQCFLDAAILEYQEDRDVEAFMLAVSYLAEAKGDV